MLRSRRWTVPDVKKLLAAAIQAVDADAKDLAADFVERALNELRPRPDEAQQRTSELPWSTDPKDERFAEFLRRALGFLRRFESAPNGTVTEDEARLFAREFFPEEPRVVGPSFYRRGLVQSEGTPDAVTVSISNQGRKALRQFERMLAQFERMAAVY
jgi:hypothetical protein